MKNWALIFWMLPIVVLGDDVYCKDGKVHRGLVLRREAGVIFGKTAAAKDPQAQETLIVANQVERIVFSEPAALRDARQAAYSGDARTVIDKIGPLISDHRIWAETPGNYWRDLMRMQVPALYVLGENEQLRQLIQGWLPTGDLDLDDSVKLLAMRMSGGDQAAFREICAKATAGNPSSLVAAIGWLELGRAALAEKKWPHAVRQFLSVEVFASSWRLLVPEALLGAVRACAGNRQQPQASVYARDLQTEFSGAPQSARINEALSGAE
jgi:hypothetical protein